MTFAGIDLAEYALYRCIKEEHKQITYSFEILDDCKPSNDVITQCVRNRIKRLSLRPGNSSTVDMGLELQERPINHCYVRENSGANMFEGDNIENAHGKDDNDADDDWLQPNYDKDNDVLQLMVSINLRVNYFFRDYFC